MGQACRHGQEESELDDNMVLGRESGRPESWVCRGEGASHVDMGKMIQN